MPLIYIPLEAVGSKWYGESEKLLSDAFKAADSLPGSIIFLDELDSLATTRSARYWCSRALTSLLGTSSSAGHAKVHHLPGYINCSLSMRRLPEMCTAMTDWLSMPWLTALPCWHTADWAAACSSAHDFLRACRGADMHEATRRLLGVLLRQLDGFDANKRSVVVGATNRMEDLDPALLSRWVAPSCVSAQYT